MTLSPDHTEPEIVRKARELAAEDAALALRAPEGLTFTGLKRFTAREVVEAFEAGPAQVQAWRPTAEEVVSLVAEMRTTIQRLRSMSSGIAVDLKSAHVARRDAASEWMREDDAELRRDFDTLCGDATLLYDRLGEALRTLALQPTSAEKVEEDKLASGGTAMPLSPSDTTSSRGTEGEVDRAPLPPDGAALVAEARDWLRELWMAPGVDGLVSRLADALESALTQAEWPAVDAGALYRLTTLEKIIGVKDFDHLPIVARENAGQFQSDLRALLSAVGGEDGTD